MAASTDRRAALRGWLDRIVPPRPAVDPAEPRLGAGWRVIAAKELGDHVTSIRFIVLIVVIGIAAAVPLYFASDEIRKAASGLTSGRSVFLALFYYGPPDFDILRADVFVGLFAPLLGIAFGFDAVNVERSEGTLPRLLSQPIHRDDVINGKFAAGLAVIALVLVAMVLLVSGFGIIRLGVVPDVSEVLRLVAWIGLTVVYAGFWLAFATLLSVAVRGAASSALIGFGLWVLTVLLGSLFLLQFIANLIAPIPPQAFTEEDVQAQIRAAQTQNLIKRLSPHTLYTEASYVLLIPIDPVSSGSFTPATIDELIQARDPNRYIGSRLSIEQSLLLVWPQVVGLVALTTVMFGAAYVVFMRQEIRA